MRARPLSLPNLLGVLRAVPITAWFRTLDPLFYLAALLVVASLTLGGGTRTGFLSDTILQWLAIPVLFAAMWRMFDAPFGRSIRPAIFLCLAIAALPFVQLVPLPPWLWTVLPNRQYSAEAFDVIGHALPWMPISVSPQATWLSALSLLPPLAIFVSTLMLAYRERRLLSLVLVAVGIVSVFVGLIQVAQGPGSPWRLFEITNPTEAVGFFANRNHFAALIYCLILFVMPWIINSTLAIKSPDQHKEQNYDLATIVTSICGFTVLVILLAGIIMARSRAGLGLTMIALLASVALGFMVQGFKSGTMFNKVLVAAIALAITFSLQFALYRFQERFSDSAQDDRVTFVRNTAEAARAYMPLGSGMGTFVPVYAMFEKPEKVGETYVNRAHNDIFEVWLESGALGIVLIVGFAIWLIRRSMEIWRNEPGRGASELDWSLVRAATIVIPLIAIHSFFDYPLRTEAMMATFAFACALLVEPPIRSEWADQPAWPAKQGPRSRDRPKPMPTRAPALSLNKRKSRRHVESPGDSSPLPGGQWGADIEWPDAWSKPSSPGTSEKKD